MTEDRLTTLYRRYGAVIYARCTKLLGDRVAAEDATQETFMRVHPPTTIVDRLREGDAMKRWIVTLSICWATVAGAETKRIAIVVGANAGNADQRPLHYA